MAGDSEADQPGYRSEAVRAKVLTERTMRLQRFEEAAVRHAMHEPLVRQRIKIQQEYALRRTGLERKQCANCWLLKDDCVCDGESPWHNFPYSLIVYMHLKEYTKSSNTGCLLQVHADYGVESVSASR